MGDEPGRWVDEPPLPVVADPPPHLILVRGAQLVRVHSIDHPDRRKREGFTEVLFIAWAPIPDSGDWAVLAAWPGHWQQHARTTGKGRWGGCGSPTTTLSAAGYAPSPRTWNPGTNGTGTIPMRSSRRARGKPPSPCPAPCASRRSSPGGRDRTPADGTRY